jgi:cholest-4-en-3-one 26-monooxygenase
MADRTTWSEGPPNDAFKRLRSECPVHWTSHVTEFPEQPGFWSLTRAEDVAKVSLDWQTFSSALGITVIESMPLEFVQAMFIGMDPPKHDRLKQLFQRGFTPKRIAEHEDAVRAITREVLTASATATRATSSPTSPSPSSRASSAASWAYRPRTTRSGRGS